MSTASGLVIEEGKMELRGTQPRAYVARFNIVTRWEGINREEYTQQARRGGGAGKGEGGRCLSSGGVGEGR
jgi:hypothetical protein